MGCYEMNKIKYNIYEMNDQMGMDYIDTEELTWDEMKDKANDGFYLEKVD